MAGNLNLVHNRLVSLPKEFDDISVKGQMKIGNTATLNQRGD